MRITNSGSLQIRLAIITTKDPRCHQPYRIPRPAQEWGTGSPILDYVTGQQATRCFFFTEGLHAISYRVMPGVPMRCTQESCD